MDDDIHSDHAYLDKWDIYAGPPEIFQDSILLVIVYSQPFSQGGNLKGQYVVSPFWGEAYPDNII